MLVHRVRGLLVAALALLAFGTATVAPASAVAHARRHHHRHHVHHRIPQHNGGDKDADNNGGPSDGDGNL